MRRLFVTAIVVLAATGCQKSVRESRLEADTRWHRMRSRITYAEAGEHLKAGRLAAAASKAQETLTLDGAFTDARVLLGKIHIERGHYDQAIEELDRSCRELPPSKSAHAWYLLGVAQEKYGQLDQAFTSYQRSHSLDGTNMAAVTATAEVLVAMGQVRRAQLYLEIYIPKAAGETSMFELAGRLAVMQKEYDKAVGFYQRACDEDRKNLRYRESLGSAQFYGGHYAEAAETLKGLAEARAEQTPSWMHTMLGDSYMALGRAGEARRWYVSASESSPSTPEVWVNLAKVEMSLEDMPRAIMAARQALQLNVRHLDAVVLLGYALVREGKVDPAVRALTEAAKLHPGSVMVRCLLGRAYALGGEHAEALRCYSAALRLEPDNQMAKELLRGVDPAKRSG